MSWWDSWILIGPVLIVIAIVGAYHNEAVEVRQRALTNALLGLIAIGLWALVAFALLDNLQVSLADVFSAP